MTDSASLNLPDNHPRVERTNSNQRKAADPGSSAWVSANAGTGKTHVLVNRILRLLLDGNRPDGLLCLTYTKAAAATMSNRLFDQLGRWATISDADLDLTLKKLLNRAPDEKEAARARRLFTQAMETPGGLKMQTIHAFCERLLRRFPLEAGISSDFRTIEEADQRQLLSFAARDTLAAAFSQHDHPLEPAVRRVADHTGDTRFEEILRDALPGLRRMSATQVSEALKRLRTALNLEPQDDDNALNGQLKALLSADEMEGLMSAIDAVEAPTNAKSASKLRRARQDSERWEALGDLFLKKEGEPRAMRTMVTKAALDGSPGLEQRLLDLQAKFYTLHQKRSALTIWHATQSLFQIVEAILTRYTDAKRRRSELDFDDLIERTNALLGDGSNTQWVLYKIDQGIEHILIDEAQDTSPDQWQIIECLADEFFAGAGAHDIRRTIFGVGDEKQSIYAFQGAEPRMFAGVGRAFREKAGVVEQPLEQIPLDLSFRTVPAVLKAVDATFADSTITPGVSFADKRPSHAAHRDGHAGLVELWPTIVPSEAPDISAFDPLADTNSVDPLRQVAARIADQVAHWLDTGARLESKGRPICPGDILILVRRRNPFSPVMIQALKQRQIPVAGADRIAIMEQLAVKDLVALGAFLILPEDDLALAAVLKSPIFGLTDDDLFDIGCAPYKQYKRPGALWTALLRAGDSNDRYNAIAAQLKKWRSQADYLPPFEFFARLLEDDQLRQRMIARLGPEAGDALDQFLAKAITYDDSAPPSLQGFLQWLNSDEPEIKRDLEQGANEVRVMTVHGAKGLEAPIVFLPDTCSIPQRSKSTMIALGDNPDDPLTAWAITNASRNQAIKKARDAEHDRAMEEYNRLLYVAMTRAEDRLYICGYEGQQKRPAQSWYTLLENQLSPLLSDAQDSFGEPVRRLSEGQPVSNKVPTSTVEQITRPLPAWYAATARQERQRNIPIAPSQIAPEIDEDLIALDAEQPESLPADIEDPLARIVEIDGPALSPTGRLAEDRFQRGIITHSLLQHLGGQPSSTQRQQQATAFLKNRAPDMTDDAIQALLRETDAVLDHPGFAFLFDEHSRAEVPIVAEIAPPTDGIPLRINGQIDRLRVLDDTVAIVDFKTNRPPPRSPEKIPLAYRLQLAAYRLAVRQLFPNHAISCFLLWTYGPFLMDVPSDNLDAAESHLWDERLDSALLSLASSPAGHPPPASSP